MRAPQVGYEHGGPMSQCANCHAGCCRSFAVPVTGADILRIEQRLGLDFWQFACRWADPAGQIAQNHAPQFYFDDEPETPFVICLMHTPSVMHPGTPKCRFLEESAPDADQPLGRAACGIYENRPGACRAFPTKLDAGGDLAVIYDVPPRGRPDPHPVYQLCPQPWEPSDFDPLQTVQDLVVARHEMEFFHLLAESWNRQCGPWNRFPEFLRIVYAGRVIVGVSEVREKANQPAIRRAA